VQGLSVFSPHTSPTCLTQLGYYTENDRAVTQETDCGIVSDWLFFGFLTLLGFLSDLFFVNFMVALSLSFSL